MNAYILAVMMLGWLFYTWHKQVKEYNRGYHNALRHLREELHRGAEVKEAIARLGKEIDS